MDSYSEHFKIWMDERGLTSESMAHLLKKGAQTISNWRSSGVPARESVRAHVTEFMEAYDAKKAEALGKLDKLTLEVEPEKFDRWNQAALAEGLIIREWAEQGLDRLAKREFSIVDIEAARKSSIYEREKTASRMVAEDTTPYGKKKNDDCPENGVTSEDS